MATTRTGKRTLHLKIQIVEEANGNITMWFDDQPTILEMTFDKDTGTSGPKAHGKLLRLLDASDKATDR